MSDIGSAQGGGRQTTKQIFAGLRGDSQHNSSTELPEASGAVACRPSRLELQKTATTACAAPYFAFNASPLRCAADVHSRYGARAPHTLPQRVTAFPTPFPRGGLRRHLGDRCCRARAP